MKEKVDPSPRADSTQRRPPCSSTIRREIDSPSPLPPFVRVLELSACWNSSKIFCWSASEIPGPVSDTDTTKAPSDARASIEILAGVGELDRVAGEVQQHLGEPALVAAAPRQIVRNDRL